MAKNRKNVSAAERFGAPIKAAVLCAFIGGAGVGYVWQKNQIHTLGVQLKQNEQRLADVRRQNKLRTDQLAYLRSPASLETRAKELKLGLGPPTPEQIWTLRDLPPIAAPASNQKQFVAQVK